MKTEQQIRDRIELITRKLAQMRETNDFDYWIDFQEEMRILYWVLDD